MIAAILRSPNNDGSFADVAGYTDSDTDVTVGGVLCKRGTIGAFAELRNEINISQARGGVATAIEGSIDLIDMDAEGRLSARLFDGSLAIYGWVLDLWQSDRGVSWKRIEGASYFAVSDVVTSGTALRLSIRARWAMQDRRLSFGSGVGLVVGGHDVSVPTVELEEPAKLSYETASGYYSGRPGGTLEIIGLPTTNATVWAEFQAATEYSPNGWWLRFSCDTIATADDFYAAIHTNFSSGVFATGSSYSTRIIDLRQTAQFVSVFVSEFFHGVEADATKIYLIAREQAFSQVVAGADLVLGWIDRTGVVIPRGDQSVTDFVISFAPAIVSPDGFVAATQIPCEVGFSSYNPPSAGLVYYGNTASIPATPGASAVVDDLGPTLVPVSGSSESLAVWFGLIAGAGGSFTIGVVPADPQKASQYSRVFVDAPILLRFKNTGSGPGGVLLGWPLNSGIDLDISDIPAGGSATFYNLTQGPVEFDSDLIFADIDDANASGFSRIYRYSTFGGLIYAHMQFLRLCIYGVTDLAFGSNYAVVRPGASSLWASVVDLDSAALALMESTGTQARTAGPNYLPSLANGGEYLEPGKSVREGVQQLAEELWLSVSPCGNSTESVNGSGLGELIQAPTIEMGRNEDVITEPVIEYQSYDGKFLGRAYVANVDQPFDSSRASDFYGGWGRSFFGDDYGREIWDACRNAYLTHGIKRGATYQWQGIHSASIVGRMMVAERNGMSRINWLCNPPRYVSLAIRDTGTSWWSGSAVTIPGAMAEAAGYDLAPWSTDPVVVTAKSLDLLRMESRYTVALPPVPGDPSTVDRIVQTLNAGNDRIVQDFVATDRITQTLEL